MTTAVRPASTSPRRVLTLGLAHELGLCASLTAATLIVLLGGTFPPWVWLASLAPTLSLALARSGVVVPGFSGTLLGLAALGAGVATVVRGGIEAAVFGGGATLLGLLAARVVTRRTLAHDQQAILLGLVLVFAGSVLNVGLSYFLVFVAYAVSTVWALATRQLLAGAEATAILDARGGAAARARERDDVITPLFFAASGAVSLAVLAAALLVFVSFPRIGFGELGILFARGSKLPRSVGFGSDPRGLSTSSEVVARVRGVPQERFDESLYLRGIVYDQLSLEAFSQSDPDTAAAPVLDLRGALTTLAYDANRAGRVEVTLMPLAGQLLFTLGHTRTTLVLGGGAANPNRVLGLGGRDRHDQLRMVASLASPLRYELRGSFAAPGVIPPASATPPQLEGAARARYLSVPERFDPRLRALLEEALRGDAPPGTAVDVMSLPAEERAARLRRYLLRNFRYSLDGDVAGASEPLKAFLLDVRAGHCELFAGGFALLLRLAGVPARVIGGFQGGALADDAVVFEMRHAHAWIEWWHDGTGWIVDDATPEPGEARERLSGWSALVESVRRFWDDSVVDYALDDQQDVLRQVGQALRGRGLKDAALGVVGAAGVVGAVGFIVRRWRRRGDDARQSDRLAGELLAAVARLTGKPPAPSATLREATAGLEPAALATAVDACERARFGDEPLSPERLDALVTALRALGVKRPDPPRGR
ncbi:MAG: transglutaminase domain-containing protein [Deltaproteobacteria bacterium]|nr:transglutaminase domain-containing protein [Deltaproteobacteria bacterium]